MNQIKTVFLPVALALTAASCLGAVDLTKLPPPAAKQGVTYATDVRSIFEASCFRCHGDEKPKAGLRLNSLDAALNGSKNGKVIVPGKSADSPLVIAVSGLDEEHAMPPRRGPGRAPGQGANRPPGGSGTGGQPSARPAGSGGQRSGGPAPKPLTAEQVALVRAWIDQGAK